MKLFLLAALLAIASGEVIERSTKISFPATVGENPLLGVGVRKKGPIKVYAVGSYSKGIATSLDAALVGGGFARKALKALLTKGFQEDPSTTFLLKMNMKVGGEKIANAISEGVGSRLSTANPAAMSNLSRIITTGLKNEPATKGTTLQFACEGSDVSVAVNGNDCGKVEGIASAFRNVYFDDKSVSDTMKENICDRFAVE